MRERNRPPFQARVASVAIITTVAVLVAACVSFMLQQWSVARQQARAADVVLASMVASSIAPDMAAGDQATIRSHLMAAGASHELVDVRLYDAAGRSLATFAEPAKRGADAGPVHTVRQPVALH